jgi:GNAT superfamily N-acetyltransferase
MMNDIVIRSYQPTDSIPEITKLLHKAYAQMAQQGMLYLASHQDDKTTEERLTLGTSFLAIKDNAIVGTITVYEADQESEVPLYRQQGVCHFGQFAVDPGLQGIGLGKRLYQTIEDRCRTRGVNILALDTAETAAHLIALYQRWGFKIVDQAKWSVVNYRSVIMARELTPAQT